MDPFLRDEHDGMNRPGQSNSNSGPGSGSGSGSNPNSNPPDIARDFTVKGQMKDLNTVFLKLRIEDTTGNVRNIHFPFDTDNDTSIAVASEMVEELDLTDQDVSTIAEMIDAEIRSCIPDWAPRDYDDDQDDADSDSNSNSEVQNQSQSQSPITIKSSTSPGTLALERLPSGRRYWSDSPKGCFSPLRPRDSNASEPVSNDGKTEEEEEDKDDDDDDDYDDDDDDDDNVDTIVEKLEHLLDEQQKEVDELRKKHELVVSDILKKLRPETRQEVANICKFEICEEPEPEPNHEPEPEPEM